MFAMAGSEPLDDLLRIFDHKWLRFWAWLEMLGRNAAPLPSSQTSELRHRGKNNVDA